MNTERWTDEKLEEIKKAVMYPVECLLYDQLQAERQRNAHSSENIDCNCVDCLKNVIQQLESQRTVERQRADELLAIVSQIMTMHWDMVACHCWICERGRPLGSGAFDELLRWKEAGLQYVSVEEPKREKA